MNRPHTLLARVPLRWRLSVLSAGLTFTILAIFAIVVGQLTGNRIRSDFYADTDRIATQLHRSAEQLLNPTELGSLDRFRIVNLPAGVDVLRILHLDGSLLASTESSPDFTAMGAKPQPGNTTIDQYRVVTKAWSSRSGQTYLVQLGRSIQPMTSTIARVQLFLSTGVLAGSGLALILVHSLLGRALAPITRLTRTARDVEQTADPSQRVPVPDTGDEVAELAQTLDRMLRRLEDERAHRELLLDRQREFVADASHELRTPLTSVLANLELLEDALEGEQRETAHSALRSTKRMRRLVSDLLTLARADASQQPPPQPVDLAQVTLDVAAEVEPMTASHKLRLDVTPVLIDGVRDQLHRLVLNLVGNALDHTPAGTIVTIAVQEQDESAILTVSDNGPGIPPELRPRIFDRFVRAGGDRGGSTGLGLAIVQAVTSSHRGEVTLGESPEGGTSFVVTLPLSRSVVRSVSGEQEDDEKDTTPKSGRLKRLRQTSTTTGRTIGRRLSRS